MDSVYRTTTSRALLGVVLAMVVLLPLAATKLEVSPHRVTTGTIVVAGLLLIGALSLPALILAKWHASDG